MEIKLSNYFPDFYSRFFPDFFNSNIEKEKIATCSNCIMLKPENTIGHQNYYSEKSKCCTFSPEIPNYLVGLILKDESDNFVSGREKIKKIIKEGVGISPEGIKPTRKYSLMYEKGKQTSFGKSSTLICPFFEDKENSCSVWNGRSAICSTFFCRYNAGTFGENFWRNIQFYLQETEKKLSQYAILKLNAFTDHFDHTPKTGDFKLYEIDENRHPDYSKIWEEWENKEIEFYLKSFEIVESLSQKEFNLIMGISNEYLIKKIKNAKELIDRKELPKKLKLNHEANIIPVSETESIISTPSGTFKIENTLVNVLAFFDGKKEVTGILLKLRSMDIEIEKDLLLSFYQNQILISVD